MKNAFHFETFVDKYNHIFEEYLSTVTAKLSDENKDYQAIQNEINSLYGQYPKILDVFDMEKSSELNEEECTALIKVLKLKSRLTDMEMEAVYFRGCYDSMGYLEKAGIL